MRSEFNYSSELAVGAYQVGKTYRIYSSAWERFQGHFLEAVPKPSAILRSLAEKHAKSLGKEFQALHDITLEIRKGESVGIIGRNGSGKSTLLQIIARTRPPTTGSVQVHGRVAAILELGSGFKPDFTGRENVYINGLILGLSREEIENKFAQIEAFADIGPFIDQPVKTYSSGMLVRLVFAVQVALDPEILIVDEALAVGDVFFQQKCARRMQDLKESGTTILFVSHSMQVVRNLCEKVIYLKEGRLEYFGDTLRGAGLYFSAPSGKRDSRHTFKESSGNQEPVPQHSVWKRFESDESPICIQWVRLADEGKGLGGAVGETICLEVAVGNFGQDETEFHCGFNLKNSFDQLIVSCSTHTKGLEPIKLGSGETRKIRIDFSLNLEPGSYTISCGLGIVGDGGVWSKIHGTGWFGPVEITWNSQAVSLPFHGPFGLPVSFECDEVENS
jgi:lipopolysaccharide transport system ATP-binding protein